MLATVVRLFGTSNLTGRMAALSLCIRVPGAAGNRWNSRPLKNARRCRSCRQQALVDHPVQARTSRLRCALHLHCLHRLHRLHHSVCFPRTRRSLHRLHWVASHGCQQSSRLRRLDGRWQLHRRSGGRPYSACLLCANGPYTP